MHQHAQLGQPASAESFPTDPSGLPEATRPELLELADGDDLETTVHWHGRIATSPSTCKAA